LNAATLAVRAKKAFADIKVGKGMKPEINAGITFDF